MTAITPEILLRAYRAGIFPMAEDASATELFWYDPPERAVLPLDRFHVPGRLARTIRKRPYRITADRDFSAVIAACAAPNAAMKRGRTWINEEIAGLYTALHRQGHAHSLEAWRDGRLAGGIYGVSIGGAFFGESMFSTATDASKICLVYLAALLRRQGYALFDAQFMTPHLRQFGATEISRADYHERLRNALSLQCEFLGEFSGDFSGGISGTGTDGAGGVLDEAAMAFLHDMTQTS
ncbi:MAG: leucyl/phenylalanyl-tRNA--protein transferase [Alphaproteobacteria bacterium]